MKADRRWWNDGRLEREQASADYQPPLLEPPVGFDGSPLFEWRDYDHTAYFEPLTLKSDFLRGETFIRPFQMFRVRAL